MTDSPEGGDLLLVLHTELLRLLAVLHHVAEDKMDITYMIHQTAVAHDKTSTTNYMSSMQLFC